MNKSEEALMTVKGQNGQQTSDIGKVVYVLGAGFSKPAGAPSQAEILSEIIKLEEDVPRVRKAKDNLRQFLELDLRLTGKRLEQAALEDIYTPIDRCIADGISLRSKNALQLAELREDLEYLISTAIAQRISNYLSRNEVASNYIDRFAEYLVKKASYKATLAANGSNPDSVKEYDPFSIISLNWDILLDNALNKSLLHDCDKTEDYDPFGVVDYCCYVSSLDQGDTRIRSGLWSLGCKGYNVKLLKLHGSMNWLQCPNCQRLFIQFGSKQEIRERVGVTVCRHCEKFGHRNSLKGSLVMPTFLKDLSNFQIKLVWQNASVELMEAKKLIFIGYSLPQADFEFRQLLSRMVQGDAMIEVVLYKGTTEDAIRRYEAEIERYSQFFGDRNLIYHSFGVEEYVNREIGGC